MMEGFGFMPDFQHPVMIFSYWVPYSGQEVSERTGWQCILQKKKKKNLLESQLNNWYLGILHFLPRTSKKHDHSHPYRYKNNHPRTYLQYTPALNL